MAKYLVKCFSDWHKGWHNLLVEANSKEEAKEQVRTTTYECGGYVKKTIHLNFVPVGAKEVEVDKKGRIYQVKPQGRYHREMVEAQKEQKVQPFTVWFISKKDGREKSTVVKAVNAREAKKMVDGARRAEKAKGKNKGYYKKEYQNAKVERNYLEVNGIPIEYKTLEEIQDMVERTSGWPSYYIETAGSVNSGMTRY